MPADSSRRSGPRRRRASGPTKGERREQAILDATERLLATTPFTELTIDQIATEAGLSRPALYFYFASKEEILVGLHRRVYDAMVRTMDPIHAPGAPIEEGMREAIERVAQNWRGHRAALRTFHETAMVSPSFERIWRQSLDQHVTALTAIVERERAAGRAAPSPPTARAIASAWFWMLENEFYLLFRRRHLRREEHDLIDTLSILWLRMTGASPG